MPGGPLIAGVDAGTSRVRALVFALDGGIVAEGSAPTPTVQPHPGWGEHDPHALWQAAAAALRAAVSQVDDPRRVRSVAVASMGEAGVLLDSAGRPLGPIIAWYDTRTAGELDRLLERVGAAWLHGVTGLCPDPTFTLLKLLWLRAHEPEAFAQGQAWLSVGGWIAAGLCGQRAIDHSLASRTLLLDLKARSWSAEILDACALPPSLLGELAPAGTRLGTLLPEAAAATGLPPDCVVALGGHDHICGLLAVGADEPGVLLDSLGTAEALLLTVPEPSAHPALLAAGINQGLLVTDRAAHLLYGGLPTSSACIEWFRGLHGGTPYERLVAEAEAVRAGAHELMFLPHLRLGSPPFPDPVARGAFVGLSDACDRAVQFRALLEGLALDAASQLELMRRHAGLPLRRVVAIGGGTRNRLLMRLKAGLFALPTETVALTESTCLGAALLGALGAGLVPSLDAARAGLALRREDVAPDPAWPAAARAARLAAYAATYAGMRAIHAGLRA